MVVRKRLGIKGKAVVFVTTTVVNWTPLFKCRDRACQVLQQLEETLSHSQVSMCAYVLMPSHLHALLGFNRVESMSRVMQSFKSLSARRLQPMIPSEWSDVFVIGGRFSVWKPRFDDLVVWSEKQFRIKADYIHNNPVKAGLVGRPTDYPFSSARDWLLDEAGLIEVDKAWAW